MRSIDDVRKAGITLYRDETTGTIRMKGPVGCGESMVKAAKIRVGEIMQKAGFKKVTYNHAIPPPFATIDTKYGQCELCRGKLPSHQGGTCLFCARIVDMAMTADAESRVIVLDTETTGFSQNVNGVIEVAFVALNKNLDIVDEFEAKMPIHHKFQVMSRSLEVNGYDPYVWRDEAIPHEEAYRLMREKIKPFDRLTGWNIGFDMRHLVGTADQLGIEWENPIRWMDLQPQVKRVIQKEMPTTSMKLGVVASYLNINHEHVHSALGDVKATADIYRWYVRRTETTSD